MKDTIIDNNCTIGGQMSRSYRQPYHHIASENRHAFRSWKRQCSSKVRSMLKIIEDPVSLSYHRRVVNQWSAPGDGKCRSDDPKVSRK